MSSVSVSVPTMMAATSTSRPRPSVIPLLLLAVLLFLGHAQAQQLFSFNDCSLSNGVVSYSNPTSSARNLCFVKNTVLNHRCWEGYNPTTGGQYDQTRVESYRLCQLALCRNVTGATLLCARPQDMSNAAAALTVTLKKLAPTGNTDVMNNGDSGWLNVFLGTQTPGNARPGTWQTQNAGSYALCSHITQRNCGDLVWKRVLANAAMSALNTAMDDLWNLVLRPGSTSITAAKVGTGSMTSSYANFMDWFNYVMYNSMSWFPPSVGNYGPLCSKYTASLAPSTTSQCYISVTNTIAPKIRTRWTALQTAVTNLRDEITRLRNLFNTAAAGFNSFNPSLSPPPWTALDQAVQDSSWLRTAGSVWVTRVNAVRQAESDLQAALSELSNFLSPRSDCGYWWKDATVTISGQIQPNYCTFKVDLPTMLKYRLANVASLSTLAINFNLTGLAFKRDEQPDDDNTYSDAPSYKLDFEGTWEEFLSEATERDVSVVAEVPLNRTVVTDQEYLYTLTLNGEQFNTSQPCFWSAQFNNRTGTVENFEVVLELVDEDDDWDGVPTNQLVQANDRYLAVNIDKVLDWDGSASRRWINGTIYWSHLACDALIKSNNLVETIMDVFDSTNSPSDSDSDISKRRATRLDRRVVERSATTSFTHSITFSTVLDTSKISIIPVSGLSAPIAVTATTAGGASAGVAAGLVVGATIGAVAGAVLLTGAVVGGAVAARHVVISRRRRQMASKEQHEEAVELEEAAQQPHAAPPDQEQPEPPAACQPGSTAVEPPRFSVQVMGNREHAGSLTMRNPSVGPRT